MQRIVLHLRTPGPRSRTLPAHGCSHTNRNEVLERYRPLSNRQSLLGGSDYSKRRISCAIDRRKGSCKMDKSHHCGGNGHFCLRRVLEGLGLELMEELQRIRHGQLPRKTKDGYNGHETSKNSKRREHVVCANVCDSKAIRMIWPFGHNSGQLLSEIQISETSCDQEYFPAVSRPGT